MITIWLATVINDGEIVTEFVSGCESNAQDCVIDWAAESGITPTPDDDLPGEWTDYDRVRDAAESDGYDIYVRSIIDLALNPDGTAAEAV